MKQRLLAIVLVMFGLHALAQNAAPSVNYEYNLFNNTNAELKIAEPLVFQSNANFWQAELQRNAKNEQAWINYYQAVKFESFKDHSRDVDDATQAKLDKILADTKQNVANSFADNYLSYLNTGNKSQQSLSFLEKAYAINPNFVEIWDDMLFKYYSEGSTKKVKELSAKLFESGVYTSGLMEYNQNVLNSIAPNGILVTYGNVDSYPLLIWQQHFNIRSDITIICLDWLTNEKYAKSISSKTKIKQNQIFGVSESAALDAIAKQGKQVYFSLTLPPQFSKKFSNELYCTGLAMLYSKNPVANVQSLKSNWEQLFKKDYLLSSEDINRNYLIPLVILYQTEQDVTKKADYKLRIEQIAERYGESATTKKFVR